MKIFTLRNFNNCAHAKDSVAQPLWYAEDAQTVT